MDVDKLSFYPLILDIITDISEAHFVAIDLELSGVPSKNSYSAKLGKPTLQQRYVETKEAAERYQILQVGLTCVEQDLYNGKYILRPYNFELSPVIHERGLEVERIFSFQSGAIEFLLNEGFDMSRPFMAGVPYLSRDETRIAREKHAMRQDKSAMVDIQLKPTETESLAFVERARSEINAYLAANRVDPLEIVGTGAAGSGPGNGPTELSRFERRLIHQLVRAEYPDLVTIGKPAYVQIVRFNQEREERVAAERKRDLEERIDRQKGFRWLIEALIGSNITGIDFREIAKDGRTGQAIFADLDQYKAQLHRAQARIRNNPRVMVGHNCFLDMVYVYRTFIGDLPDTVEEFQARLHELWPVIVDTKYMSTHKCGDINPVSSLGQIAQQMRSEQTPQLETDSLHNKYDQVAAFHEAGYDSFLTAQVAVKLSAKLHREGAYIEEQEKLAADLGHLDIGGRVHEGAQDSIIDATNDKATQGDVVATPAELPSFTPSIVGSRWKKTGDPTLGPLPDGNAAQYNPRNRKHHYKDIKANQTFEGGMPSFGSSFWRAYGNKLRVFGTEEGVCPLDSRTYFRDSEDGGVGV